MINLIMAMTILALGLALMKRWFPNVYNLQKRFGKWALKGIATWLWTRPEKKGGANVSPPRMRWRE